MITANGISNLDLTVFTGKTKAQVIKRQMRKNTYRRATKSPRETKMSSCTCSPQVSRQRMRWRGAARDGVAGQADEVVRG